MLFSEILKNTENIGMFNGTPCWQWTGRLVGTNYKKDPSRAYGSVWFNGRLQGVHRIVYAETVGPIPEGLQIDHLCRNRRCHNPLHLEAVTSAENTRRGLLGTKPTHCPQGHPYDAENTFVRTKGRSVGSWQCRECGKQASQRLRDRRKSNANA